MLLVWSLSLEEVQKHINPLKNSTAMDCNLQDRTLIHCMMAKASITSSSMSLCK